MERLFFITDHRGNRWMTTLDYYGDGKGLVSDILIVVAAVCAIFSGILWGVS